MHDFRKGRFTAIRLIRGRIWGGDQNGMLANAGSAKGPFFPSAKRRPRLIPSGENLPTPTLLRHPRLQMSLSGEIRIGISGWRYKGWRGSFYPPDLVQRRELEFASRRLTSIELNGSFYSLQRPESFQTW
jgi:hypothetical protein